MVKHYRSTTVEKGVTKERFLCVYTLTDRWAGVCVCVPSPARQLPIMSACSQACVYICVSVALCVQIMVSYLES